MRILKSLGIGVGFIAAVIYMFLILGAVNNELHGLAFAMVYVPILGAALIGWLIKRVKK